MIVPYKITLPVTTQVPIIVSVPHCGVEFPAEIKDEYKSHLIAQPDDTDWFVHQLYDFVSTMGITMIHAVYSRWVIDLNRDPQSKPLYNDGRIITGLCPATNFIGEHLYKDERNEVDAREVSRRLEVYYQPYHQKLQSLLDDAKSRFGKVLLWDCHSIRTHVKTIQHDRFPDLILGDADGSAADPNVSLRTMQILKSSRYRVNHNHPFKGGQITRFFGKPSQGVSALQLEMTKINYMDDSELTYDPSRANELRSLLKKVFESLIEQFSV